jgi:hypothetical protein
MSKDPIITAQDGGKQAKPRVAKPAASKSAASKSASSKRAGSKSAASKPKSTKAKTRTQAKSVGPAPTKTAVKKAAKATHKAAGKTKAAAKTGKKVAGEKSVNAKPATQKELSVSTASLGRSLQATMPVAFAVNTKLVDIAHSNVSAGLELARDLAGAKTPMEAMRLGVAYWFNHIGAVQAQTRELQSLSVAWVKTAGAQIRAL